MSKMLGAPLKRREDPEILRGVLVMATIRNEHAHAEIGYIDISDASRAPGVVRVITAADLVGKVMPLPCIWIPGGVESHFPSHPFGVPGGSPVLASNRVRYIGDPVAVVLAETRYQAFDALNLIKVDYAPLPVV